MLVQFYTDHLPAKKDKRLLRTTVEFFSYFLTVLLENLDKINAVIEVYFKIYNHSVKSSLS